MKRYIWIVFLIACWMTSIQQVAGKGLADDVTTPFWLWHDCEDPAHVTIGWITPPADVLPFEPLFAGFLTVHTGVDSRREFLYYYGSAPSPYGTIYTWRATYTIPAGQYSLSAYVENQAGEAFNVQPAMFQPGCAQVKDILIFLPVVLR